MVVFWKLSKVQATVLFSTVVLTFVILQQSLQTLDMRTTKMVPGSQEVENCLPIPHEALRNNSTEPFFVVGKGVTFRVEPFKTLDLGEVPPVELFIEDKKFWEEVKKLNNSRLRFDQYIPLWFSESDVIKMEMMSHHNITHVFSIFQHPRLQQVIFKDDSHKDINDFEDCLTQCAMQKSRQDIYEVFAFHLDRVLGLNRSMPVVTRDFNKNNTKEPNYKDLGNRFTDGKARPLIWWDPHIHHSGTLQPDQNSMSIWWTDYQYQLSLRCYAKNNMEESERHENCTTKVRHIEWGRLALYDFLLQNHDRIDRSCCGYDIDEGELCFANGQRKKECSDIKHQHLVHIFTHTYDDSRLVYIDNAFNVNRSAEHLNYRLLEGIDEIPEYPISVLKSGKFREAMLQSLYLDRVYWEQQGGRPFMDNLIDVTEKRAQKLIAYIENRDISLVQDY